jgi:hypothetical protein
MDYRAPNYNLTDLDVRTSLLLQRALSSLAMEASRRRAAAIHRPEGEAMWRERQVEHIREWVSRG